MDEVNFRYGCQSAIQKAIRRSDLDLAKTTFDFLWSIKDARTWLQWRTTILVEEDCWQMIGELAKFYASKPKNDEAAWRKLLYSLVLVDKSKDTEALWDLATRFKHLPSSLHPELEEMRFWLAKVKGDDPASIAEDVFKSAEAAGLTEYELNACRTFRSRVYQGGMLADRFSCLAGIVLIKKRRLKEEEVAAHVQEATKRYFLAGGKKPISRNALPWWSLDMHTQIGKMASSAFMKRIAPKYQGLDKLKFEDVWFMLESAEMKHSRLSKLKESPSCFESMWWPIYLKEVITFGGRSVKEVGELWQKEMRGEVQKLVEWAVKKKAQEAAG